MDTTVTRVGGVKGLAAACTRCCHLLAWLADDLRGLILWVWACAFIVQS